MNFIFISPNFPTIYSKFVKELKKDGANVLTIGDTPYNQLNEELKIYATEYYFVPNLGDFEKMVEAVRYFERRYGHIDFLESNNEYWLEQDARLREIFHIDTGFYPAQMELIKYKSKMKDAFIKAGCKVARYILSSTFEESKKFAAKVGYPIFAKPDNGVGAAGTFKINNEDDLFDFYLQNLDSTYILEEYIDGEIVSFDGVVNLEGDVPFCVEEHFPTPVAKIVHDQLDFYYYCLTNIDPKLEKLGRKAVKEFGISKRNFHIEFFKLNKDKEGLGKAGDYVAIECNMRSPGGDTPELISSAINRSYYKIYADVINFNELREKKSEEEFVAISVSRRLNKTYMYTIEYLTNKYRENIVKHGIYTQAIAVAMGDIYCIAKFKSLKEALAFKDQVLKA